MRTHKRLARMRKSSAPRSLGIVGPSERCPSVTPQEAAAKLRALCANQRREHQYIDILLRAYEEADGAATQLDTELRNCRTQLDDCRRQMDVMAQRIDDLEQLIRTGDMGVADRIH